MTMVAHPSALVRDAEALARHLLSGDSDRFAHCRYSASIAEIVSDALGVADQDQLVAAAWLHDIGYVPDLRRTGFHPLDGALYLAANGWPPSTVMLVAHHSFAAVLAPYFNVEAEMAILDRVPGDAENILTYADLRSGTTGMGAQVEERIAEMRIRHAESQPVPPDVREARYELLLNAAHRISELLSAQPSGWSGRRRTRATSLSGTRLKP